MTTRRGDHHRQRANRGDERRDAVGQPVAGRHVAGVDPLDVERAQPFVHELGELRGQRRLLDVVFALKQIDADRRDRRTGDLLADARRRAVSDAASDSIGDQNASRIALTMVRANSVLMRSSALASWPKNAAGSSCGLAALAPRTPAGRRGSGFSHSTLFSRTSRSSIRAVIVIA